jgi:predicted acetyltransferase
MLTRAYVAARADFPDDVRELGRYSEFDPEGGPDNWVVIWEGSRPVSALRLFYREVEIGGDPVRFAGIGNVGTDPECGGRGLGRAVMEAAHQRLVDESVPVVLLVTDIPEFYARLGYEVVEQLEVRGPRRPADGVTAGGAATRLDASTPTPAWIHDLHRRLAAATGGRVVRSAHYWTRWIDGFRAAPPIERWALPDRAYLIGRREEDGAAFRVLEAAGAIDAVEALMATAAGSAGTIKAPDDDACRKPMDRLTSALERRTRRGIMARPIAPDGPSAGAFAGFLELDTF